MAVLTALGNVVFLVYINVILQISGRANSSGGILYSLCISMCYFRLVAVLAALGNVVFLCIAM